MKWVTNWSNAISIATNKPERYTKDVTIRYPICSVFDGEKIRITLDNFTGTEPVTFNSVTIATTDIMDYCVLENTITDITFNGSKSVTLEAGQTIQSDEIEFKTTHGKDFSISFYFKDYTSLKAAVITKGPLSRGYFSLEDQTHNSELPMDLYKSCEWFYFLSDVEVYTSDSNKAILCFGDSITAEGWPEFLQLQGLKENVAFPRKAASGGRILREYHNVRYESYGLKSETRIIHDTNIQGCEAIVILQGINDIIHPVGRDANPYRPWSDLPSANDIIEGYRILIKHAREKGLRVYFGTLIPFKGWRTYETFREVMKQEVNQWIRTTDEIDGYIDFEKDLDDNYAFKAEFDSGDHLHPSSLGYQQMAKTAYEALKKYGEI